MRFQKLCWVALVALLAQNTLVQAEDGAVDKKDNKNNRTWGQYIHETTKSALNNLKIMVTPGPEARIKTKNRLAKNVPQVYREQNRYKNKKERKPTSSRSGRK